MAVQLAEGHTASYSQNGHTDLATAEESKDPIVEILSAFYAIPNQYHADLFESIREAAESRDLRRLLDAISDWAATAQLYADPDLTTELTDAPGDRPTPHKSLT